MAFLSLQIKPNDEWLTAVISPDSSVSIEIINSLFDIDAGGGFSYPFTLSVEANQHLFPTLTNNHGAHVYDLIYHKPFRLYAGGVPLFHGIVDMDDEVEIETQNDGTHTVAINLASDNQELSALLDGVNCQDVPVKDKIPVGTEFRSINFTFYDGNYRGMGDFLNGNKHRTPHASYKVPIPPQVFSLNKYKKAVDGSGEWVNSTNVSEPYPNMAYCNARVGIQAREKQQDGTYKTLREYELFDADRPNTGVCFYVMYFFDCLFANLNVVYNNKSLLTFEDIARLAFFNTKCECESMPTAKDYNLGELQELLPNVGLQWNSGSFTGALAYEFTANAYIKYANSKNFPDAEAKSILQDFQNAFGIRFIYDSEMRHCKAVFIKDVLNDHNPIMSAAIIHEEEQADRNIRGVKMTFGVDDEDNTSYNFENKDSAVVQRSGFASIEVENSVNDTHTYYDIVTGNMYRIKVDEDAKTEDELYPSLFEIKQFSDAWIGDITNDNFVRSIEVAFSPVIINRVKNTTKDNNGKTISTSPNAESSQEPIPFVFIDKEISDAEVVKLYNAFGYLSAYDDEGNRTDHYSLPGMWYIQYAARYGFSSEYIEAQKKYAEIRSKRFTSTIPIKSKPVVRYDEDPLATYDAGYTLGVMRGPGNSSGTEIVQEDYDGNGNARWAYVPTSYAFTSDSIDEYGRPYDYNGIAEGGIDMSGRMSLKLWAEKASLFQKKSIEGTSVTVTTAEDAKYWLSVLFHDSTMDIFNLHPKTKKEVEEKNWIVDDIDGIVYCLPRLVNGFYAGLYNAIQPDGTVLSPTEFNKYIFVMPSQGDVKGLLIKENATEEDYNNFVGLVNLLYAPESAPAYTIPHVPESALTEFYPINSANAHRGLFHKFNYEYAYFLIHARIVKLTTTMSLAELSSLDLTKWHTFGQYTGLIKQVSYDLDNERGLSDVIIELYYL